MIKKVERNIRLYSLEKDGMVHHLMFDFENKRKFAKLKKKYTIVEHSLVMQEKVYVPTDKEMLKIAKKNADFNHGRQRKNVFSEERRKIQNHSSGRGR